jgi:hypothetical protein
MTDINVVIGNATPNTPSSNTTSLTHTTTTTIREMTNRLIGR